MQATVGVKELTKAISQVKNLTGAEHISMIADPAGLHVCAAGNGVNVSLTLEAEVRNNGKVTLDHLLLSGVIKGRKKVEMTLKSSDLSFKEVDGRKYSGNIVVLPFEDVMVNDASSKPIKISSDAQATLNQAVELVGLTNIYTDDPMYVWVISTKKATTVTCFDDFHMAHYHNPSMSLGQVEFQLSLATFKTLNTLSNGKSYKLELNDGTLTAYNDAFKANMPLTQSESSLTPDQVKQLLSNLKTDGYFEVERDTFQTILENAASAYEGNNTPLTISSNAKKKLELAIKGNYVNMREVLPNKHKIKKPLQLDPSLMLDIMEHVEAKEVKVEIVTDKSLFIRQELGAATVVYAGSLI